VRHYFTTITSRRTILASAEAATLLTAARAAVPDHTLSKQNMKGKSVIDRVKFESSKKWVDTASGRIGFADMARG